MKELDSVANPSSVGSEMGLTATTIQKLKQASFQWLYGFKEGCCIHRAFILCYRSRSVLIRTGQCFLFHGLIFLGSVFILKSFLIPMLHWILPEQCPQIRYEEICNYGVILSVYATMRTLLIQVIYLLWFCPLYMFSFILSTIWTMIGIGEQIYSVLLLNFFFLEVFATGFIPYGGKALNFLLLSWMYAYYCFEYKWNLSGVTLSRRLDFFESNWAFFAGFGSPCVLAIFFFLPMESYAVMATLFPLFVLTATESEADNLVASPRKLWLGTGLGRVPIFCGADTILMKILSILPLKHLDYNQGKKAL